MIPVRTCVGCRTADEANNLVRYVLIGQVVTRDSAHRQPGRGAWLHDSPICWRSAVKRGGFARSFKAPAVFQGFGSLVSADRMGSSLSPGDSVVLPGNTPQVTRKWANAHERSMSSQR